MINLTNCLSIRWSWWTTIHIDEVFWSINRRQIVRRRSIFKKVQIFTSQWIGFDLSVFSTKIKEQRDDDTIRHWCLYEENKLDKKATFFRLCRDNYTFEFECLVHWWIKNWNFFIEISSEGSSAKCDYKYLWLM